MKTKGIYFLYRVLQAFGLPFLILYFVFRGARNRGYWSSLPQRFGFLPGTFCQTGPGAIWLHAVSVGEVLSCLEFVRRLRAALPRTRVFVSTTTLAGQETAQEKLRGLADGVFFAPVDYVFAVRRVLRTLRPTVVVIAETEVWPNLFREVKRTGAAVTIVNGRISDRAFPRYRRWRWFFRAVLPAVDSVLAQTAEVGERFAELGMPRERISAAGNFKYDFEARPADASSPALHFIENARPCRVWMAASTMPPADGADADEDDVVIGAYRKLREQFPELVLVLAPRKPERFGVVVGKLDAAGVPYARRSKLSTVSQASACAAGSSPNARVLLLDTIGELSGLFAAADVVFMGGSLARKGGHNILEPAMFGKPVITGPHMENFRAIADQFRTAGAVVEIAEPNHLAGAVARLLSNSAEAAAIGAGARRCAESQRGATGRAIEEVSKLYRRGVPRYRPNALWLWALWPLALCWEWGSRRKRRNDLAVRRKLEAPVISVGNLTMGGTGKTPCVLRLVELLRERGKKPGILTRGYGRAIPQEYVALAPGAKVVPEVSGDEAQIFLRSGLAPVGIGASRYESGTRLGRTFHTDVFVLDDGFQHWKLERDLDVVLIDALQPFGGGHVFPLGRLREPEGAVARAGAVVITRSAYSDLAEAIETEVRKWNRSVPVFRASVEPRAWVEQASGRRLPVTERPFGKAGVFCGIGNPESFRRTLSRLGVGVVEWVDFADHHRYRPRELRAVAHHAQGKGATALVTTEKDSVNLCAEWKEVIAPLELWWLEVGMKIEGEGELVEVMERALGR